MHIVPFAITLPFSIVYYGIAIAHSNVFQGIAPLWKKRDEESMRDGPPHFCRLTRILSLSTIQFPETMEGDLRRQMAQKIHGEKFERVKGIAELCALGPITQKVLIEKFGEDIGRIISSFVFSDFESRV